MRTNNIKTISKAVFRVVSSLSFAAVVAFGQQQVNMTAGPASITLPDGSDVPMWGYSCGAVVVGSTATCAKLNPTAAGWSPVVITVPTGQTLQINLTNSLSFGAASLPTSLTIVGQLGGGLGTPGGATASPAHNPQPLTWPVAGGLGDPTNTPPAQGSRVRSFSMEVAAGATTALTWTAPRAGTYLLESGTHPSIQGPMGLYGMVVVTDASTGTAYPGVAYNADVKLLLSEIDPVQNIAVQTAVNTAGFSETKVWSGQPGGCGNPSSPTFNTCYPPVVNYSPLYYLFNGVAFDKTNPTRSLFPTSPGTGLTPVTGKVLVRLVNAGLHMHIPSIVGAQTGVSSAAGLALIAEDGNPLPGVPRVQSSVFLAAGKTYDVMVNVPAAGGTALPVFDRQLGLSGNKTARDAGMLAYIGINGSGLPSATALTSAAANPDTYNSLITGKTLTVSDPAKGVLANDVGVYGVKVLGTVPGLALNTDGTFTYTGAATTFTYCGNGTTTGPACATVTLGAAAMESASGITLADDGYTSKVATSLSIKFPGILVNDTDAAGYPLSVATPLVSVSAGLTVSVDSNGGFNASVAAPGTYTFAYKAQNSQGTLSASAAIVTLSFPAASNLSVTLVDGKTKTALSPQDYRWVIEEDRTFYVDPGCTTNPPPAGCPGNSTAVVPTFGVNFHASHMPVIAQGCTGANSCEGGQTFLDPTTGMHVPAVCDIGNGACRPGSTKTAVLPSFLS